MQFSLLDNLLRRQPHREGTTVSITIDATGTIRTAITALICTSNTDLDGREAFNTLFSTEPLVLVGVTVNSIEVDEWRERLCSFSVLWCELLAVL